MITHCTSSISLTSYSAKPASLITVPLFQCHFCLFFYEPWSSPYLGTHQTPISHTPVLISLSSIFIFFSFLRPLVLVPNFFSVFGQNTSLQFFNICMQSLSPSSHVTLSVRGNRVSIPVHLSFKLSDSWILTLFKHYKYLIGFSLGLFKCPKSGWTILIGLSVLRILIYIWLNSIYISNLFHKFVYLASKNHVVVLQNNHGKIVYHQYENRFELYLTTLDKSWLIKSKPCMNENHT